MSWDGHSGRGGMGEAFILALALQRPIALEIWGWDCVSPGDSRVQQQGRGRLLPRIWLHAGVLQTAWPQVVLLYLGSASSHRGQPCISFTAWVGLHSPRSLSQGSPHPILGSRQILSPACHGCAMCLCAGYTHLPHAPSLTHSLFVSIAARARFLKLNQM